MAYSCPSCGHFTRAEKALGTGDACPVCGWVDVPLDTNGAQDRLHQTQLSYERARTDDAESVLSLIRSAFGDGSREGRVDLRTAMWRDSCDRTAKLPVPDWTDDDQHWWEIPDPVLELFQQRSSVFSFGNAASFCYYLPAYLSLDLRTTSNYGIDALWNPHVIDDGGVLRDPLSLVTDDQRFAVVAYLKWMVQYERLDRVRSSAMTVLLRWDTDD